MTVKPHLTASPSRSLSSSDCCAERRRGGLHSRTTGDSADRDIVVKVVAAHKDPGEVRAGELAEGTPVTVDVGDDARKVVSVMAQHQIRRVLVLEDQRLVGMIAQADIAVELDNEQTGGTVEAVSLDF
ncbi:CBS domain-containing protein [Nocardia arizonensis]|uniref:CBS domain-containing protein n=1 Tax=Nocardia arizonensis TaxID=1141647 RepID=UPI0006CF3484|nr:CBS domain-containing protein [Nocardia arizonensis]